TEELDAFFTRYEFTGSHRRDEAELRRVRAIRGELEGFFSGDEERVVALVNTLLLRHRALPRVVRHGDVGWHIHATDDDAPFE
ncbi:ABATE domain-containing protein, partial [Vibrio cholerae]|uniref:ABATE domain-containing protein n=1 Tax=Vibrio cholerae TaxID=666 RepID=UPI0015A2526B